MYFNAEARKMSPTCKDESNVLQTADKIPSVKSAADVSTVKQKDKDRRTKPALTHRLVQQVVLFCSFVHRLHMPLWPLLHSDPTQTLFPLSFLLHLHL